jgi:hypothetical protein
MLGDVQVVASADAMQAGYFHGLLREQRAELEAHLASLTRRLTECLTVGDLTPISHVRHAIRDVEWEARAVDRMLCRLEHRFFDDASPARRRA